MTENSILQELHLFGAGETGLVAEFGQQISPRINAAVHRFSRLLRADLPCGVTEIVPTYCAVTIYFDPLCVKRHELEQTVRNLALTMETPETVREASQIIYIPVCYGGVLGPDMDYAVKYTGLPAEEIIRLHTEKPYLVYTLGFTPGFPYLGGLQPELFVPRQEKPRLRVPTGSVGIGGGQTGFYPSESPGEWWLIGRTPVKAFDPEESNPFLLTAGDFVQFFSVDRDTYFSIRREVAAHSYVCRREEAQLG